MIWSDGKPAREQQPRTAGNVVDIEECASPALESDVAANHQASALDNQERTLNWESEEDPGNPLNWSTRRKWVIITIVSFIELLTHLTSLMFAPGLTQVQKDFEVNNGALVTLAMTVYVLGFAVGPLLFAPMSEVYGRMIIYRLCISLFFIFTIACALASTLNMLIVFRFIAGCFGAAPVAIGGAMVSDLFRLHDRGRAMAVYQLGPIMGNLLGPPIGGLIIQNKGWRWVFWVMSTLAGFATICAILILKETHAATILRKRHRSLEDSRSSDTDAGTNAKSRPVAATLARAVRRPLKLVFLSPVVLCCFLAIAMLIGTMNLLFATLGLVYQQHYHFSPGLASLTYLGMTIGFVVGAFGFGKTSDHISIQLTRKRGGKTEPEYRLPAWMLGSPLVVAGLFWYGWALQAHTFWLIPIFGLTLVGLGTTAMQLSSTTYLVDCFTEFAASALATLTVARSIGGSLIPIAGRALYDHLGFGWGNSVLAFLNLVFLVIPYGLWIYGKKLRENHRVEGL